MNSGCKDVQTVSVRRAEKNIHIHKEMQVLRIPKVVNSINSINSINVFFIRPPINNAEKQINKKVQYIYIYIYNDYLNFSTKKKCGISLN